MNSSYAVAATANRIRGTVRGPYSTVPVYHIALLIFGIGIPSRLLVSTTVGDCRPRGRWRMEHSSPHGRGIACQWHRHAGGGLVGTHTL